MRYVALLRAVNVGGNTVIRMDALRGLFEDMGFGNVKTFIASGNVLFDSGKKPGTLEKDIELKLISELGYQIDVFIRTTDELEAISCENEKDAFYIAFLKSEVDKKALASLNTNADVFFPHGRDVYWDIKGNFTDSTLTPAKIERTLGRMTVRNINTVRKLSQM